MKTPRIRCAIYTRKSSDEGLDQDFNSLDAQHEACAAYIASQRHEGWRMLPARYDDGGISGGTLERPGLQRLLADIDAGRIDMVVVYKIDRLTRSLADFARLVDRLEGAGCSFVSVTQAFNTSSSMGRLTLNVLLSFAQFEREVTAERIRDKIAASKKKGLWMGGVPPLGYDPHPDPLRRELVVNAAEAGVVAQLFALYAKHHCLSAVAREAEALGLRSKRHSFSTGREQGGTVLSRGQIHKILTNPIYLGTIRHKDTTYLGKHPAIIDRVCWDKVQELLQKASAKRRGPAAGKPVSEAAPLKGKLRDETGDPLTPTHTQKNEKRLRYYISHRLISGGADLSGWRLPAPALEATILSLVTNHLTVLAERHTVLASGELHAVSAAADRLRAFALQTQRDGIRSAAPLIRQCTLEPARIAIALDGKTIADAVNVPAAELHPDTLRLERPFTCKRRGVETKIVAGDRKPRLDPAMVRALRNAHRWSASLKTGQSLKRLANDARISERYAARIIALSGLSPKIQTAIVDGTQPVDLTLQRLVSRKLPLAWDDQEQSFGI
ncbi:recombinase family protein [Oceanomicrobium pacificus]|uniref:Recombinase family protein n=1 Tax=Oceanomicrobium pacificus TaxID=2692916 RepID=A0A6B0TZ93_9RHOB|nr:recombinase family protein [Oceanomicrobium pacificus]MXU66592.1 recombinase family protein [Oceanomicrobium pacificus]